MLYIRNIAKGEGFRTLSYKDLYHGKFRPSAVDDKTIAIIGVIDIPLARRLKDLHETQFGPESGAILNALALNTILQDQYLRQVGGMGYYGILWLGCFLVLVLRSVISKKYKWVRWIIPMVLPGICLFLTYFCVWVQTIPLIIALALTVLIHRFIFQNYFRLSEKVGVFETVVFGVLIIASVALLLVAGQWLNLIISIVGSLIASIIFLWWLGRRKGDTTVSRGAS